MNLYIDVNIKPIALNIATNPFFIVFNIDTIIFFNESNFSEMYKYKGAATLVTNR
jgi:hypothetical protein